MKAVDERAAYLVDGGELARIYRVAKRLFSEERMDANGMRDCAQSLERVIDDALRLSEDEVDQLTEGRGR